MDSKVSNSPKNYLTFPSPRLIPAPEILKEVFIYNKYSQFIPVIKSHTSIEKLFDKLKNPRNDKELIFLLKTLEKIIDNNPDIITLLSPINSNNQFFTTLIEVYLNHCDGKNASKEILDITIDICKFIAHVLIITETQYKTVYNFIANNKNLTIETTDYILTLLECLYLHSICIIKKINDNESPKNYIAHNGDGHIEILNSQALFDQNVSLLNFNINFYIRSIGDDMSNYFNYQKNNKSEYPSSIFEILLNDGSVFKLCLESNYERMFCIYDASQKKSKQNELFAPKEEIYWYTNLEENSWYSLKIILICVKKDIISQVLCKVETIPNNTEHAKPDCSIYKTDIHTLERNKIINIKFYNNFYGLSTSIIIGNLKGEDEEIKMSEIKKFGIYNRKSFESFKKLNDNIRNSAKIKCFSPHKFQYKEDKSYITLYDLYNSKFECQIVNKKFPIQNKTEKDSPYFIFNMPHVYKNVTKKMYDVGSIIQLIPILETLIRKNCLSRENFKIYFNLIKIKILKNRNNLLDAISNDFFIALSLIFEALDKKHFSKEIFEGIVSINVYYLLNLDYLFKNESNIKKIISFPKYIFFNQFLIKKFDSLTWNFILDEMVRFFNNLLYKRAQFSEPKIFSLYIDNIITVEGIIQIIRDIDKFYPTKMCCIKHALFYGKQCVSFKLENSFRTIEGLFDILMTLIFTEKKIIFSSLLRLTVLSFSPCMKNFIFRRFDKFVETLRTNEKQLNEFKTFCKKENIPNTFVYLISISDIIVQYKLIHLYTILLELDQDAFNNDTFFDMMQNSLFLNNIHKEHYISKEETQLQKDKICCEKKRSLSSYKRECNENLIYLPYKQNDIYLSKNENENNNNKTKCELINFYELIPSHFRKEYSDNKKAYLLQLFDKFRQLLLLNIQKNETQVYKKKCLFLFNCLCIFVTRSNDIKILTLFCEAIKEIETIKKSIYHSFVHESNYYFKLLFENYFHLKILHDQNFTEIGSPYIDKEKGLVTESIKKIIMNLNKTLLDLIKVLLKYQNNLHRLFTFCTFNQLLYKHDSHIKYIKYIKTLFYDLSINLFNEIKDHNNSLFQHIFTTFANIVFEFCFVFNRNYELITKKYNETPSPTLCSLPHFFLSWYNEQQQGHSFVLIVTFVETFKNLWNYSESFSFALTDINFQNENKKQTYIDELISKYVYPKDRIQVNYYNKLCYLCLTQPIHNQKYISPLKIIAYYYLSIFFSSKCNSAQNHQEAVKLFIFLFSVIIISANVNIEVPKKGTPEETNINKINSECLEVLVVVFGNLLSFYFQTSNEELKKDFKDWLILTFNFITNIFNHKKSRKNPSNPIYKLFKEVFVNDKKRNILLDPGKFSIKLKSYNDHQAILEDRQFWLTILQKNKEVQKLSINFYQQETIYQNCVNRFIDAQNFIPLNIHFFKYHSLNVDKIGEFNLKVETPYISLLNPSQSITELINVNSKSQNDFTIKFLVENSQHRRTFNYYKQISLYQNLKTIQLHNLWNFSSLQFKPNEIEQDELYHTFFHKRYNDSEYVQKYYFNCIYNNPKESINDHKGILLMDCNSFMFIANKNKSSQLKHVHILFDNIKHINNHFVRQINCAINSSFTLEIICKNIKNHLFTFDKLDFKEIYSLIKKTLPIGKTKVKGVAEQVKK